MILRVVSGRVDPGALESVVATYQLDSVPVAREMAGLDRYLVAARALPGGGHALAAITLWTSVEDALVAYDGDLAAVRTLDGRPHGETLTGVDYYEVDEAGARRTPGTATRLRLIAGTVARSQDADIQQEFRRHLPELPVEAVDAFVGRRVHGAAVEIAFVTTWTGTPPGMALDQPLWPAIVSLYEHFAIDVFDIQLSSVGPAGR